MESISLPMRESLLRYVTLMFILFRTNLVADLSMGQFEAQRRSFWPKRWNAINSNQVGDAYCWPIRIPIRSLKVDNTAKSKLYCIPVSTSVKCVAYFCNLKGRKKIIIIVWRLLTISTWLSFRTPVGNNLQQPLKKNTKTFFNRNLQSMTRVRHIMEIQLRVPGTKDISRAHVAYIVPYQWKPGTAVIYNIRQPLILRSRLQPLYRGVQR